MVRFLEAFFTTTKKNGIYQSRYAKPGTSMYAKLKQFLTNLQDFIATLAGISAKWIKHCRFASECVSFLYAYLHS